MTDEESTPIPIAYPYVDREGRLLYEVQRRPGKKFLQRRPGPDGDWIYNLDDVERVPYRLPSVLEAGGAGGTVFIVEGEKDADRLVSAGLVATTSAQGSAFVWPVEWAEHFRGCRLVVVIADNDDGGRRAANQRAAVVQNAVADVRVIEAMPGVGEKGDVSDWLNAGGSVDELRSIVKAIAPGVPVLRDEEPPTVDVPDSETETILFRRWTTAELLAADRTFKWRVRGLIVEPTYGMIGGERKSLKSYFGMFVNLGTASGASIFGQFHVDEPGPVVAYVGEGGRIPYTRRLERVAACMGVDLDTIPMLNSFDTAGLSSTKFQLSLRRDLAELEPVLVSVDPLYAFHGTSKGGGGSLYEEGALLNALSEPCVEAGASVMLTTHYNKTGTGRGLDRLTMSGGQEWSDSWWLLSHRQPPDVEGGRFWLRLEVGSRQWGGSQWDLNLSLGRFNAELGEYDGEIDWDISRHVAIDADDDAARIIRVVSARPNQLTSSEVVKEVGGKAERVREALAVLIDNGVVTVFTGHRKASNGAMKRVQVLGLSSSPSGPPESGGGVVVPIGTSKDNEEF